MTVHVLLYTDFEQEMYGSHPTRFVSPGGGSDPTVSESTDGPIRTQCIHNPIWNGLTNGKGAVERYDHLPNQYAHYTKYVQSLLTGGFKVLNMIFKSKFCVKDKTKELRFFHYFYRCFPQDVRVWGKNVLLMKMNTDRLRGGELEAVLRHPLLNAVYTQLHTSLLSV